MRRRRLDVIGLAVMSLVAGLLWYGGTPVRAQDGPKEAPGPMPPVEMQPDGKQPVAILGAPALPGCPVGQASCPGCGDQKKKDDAPKSPWANVPPVRILPPPGYFVNLPTGPGYYSLWDVLKDDYRESPPKYGYPRFFSMQNSFFDADFRYLDDPKNQDFDLFDDLHRCHLGDCWLFATGGEFRYRHMYEVNSRLTGITNNYEQVRARAWGDLWYKDIFRVYIEFMYADSYGEVLPPLVIDRDPSDLLNAFVELKLGEINGKPIYLRTGRQEMLLGSQRLISPLDWANTRRTFQGFRAYRQGEKFDVDLFYVQPVIPNFKNFDSVDNHQNFAGLWTTYRPQKGHFIDAYYLFLDNTQPAILKPETSALPFNVHNLGTRYTGNIDQRWQWDVELDLQLGSRGPQDIVAGAAAVDAGYHFKDVPWNPTFWACWEFASGTQKPGGSTFSTFNQLFPFGHYYFGFLDLVGRQNIHDLNVDMYLYPTNWITVVAQYHHFYLAAAKDALYSAGGVVERRDVTGKAGTNVGDEIDIAINFHLDKHNDFFVGYSQLFSGSFIRNTGPGLSPELFYTCYTFRW
jgi:hypothetical protein